MSASRQALNGLLPLFDAVDVSPRYNIAPTQPVLAVRAGPEEGELEVVSLRWGLVPSWADDPKIGYRMINARAETVGERPAFRTAFQRRRCLVLADGFFEWQKQGKHKVPFHLCLHERAPFAFAGLWEHWERDGEILETCTLLTTTANDFLRPIHERMPVILPRSDYDRWLDPQFRDASALQALLLPYPAEAMSAYPVSSWVNDAKHDDERCVQAA
jgi:putative SOS response-associated peptidase YedK